MSLNTDCFRWMNLFKQQQQQQGNNRSVGPMPMGPTVRLFLYGNNRLVSPIGRNFGGGEVRATATRNSPIAVAMEKAYTSGCILGAAYMLRLLLDGKRSTLETRP